MVYIDTSSFSGRQGGNLSDTLGPNARVPFESLGKRYHDFQSRSIRLPKSIPCSTKQRRSMRQSWSDTASPEGLQTTVVLGDDQIFCNLTSNGRG